jgi:hypothetical protein
MTRYTIENQRSGLCLWDYEAPNETEANISLIAAAPDLLDLARAFKSFLEDDSRSPRRRSECLAACIDAIAKATS